MPKKYSKSIMDHLHEANCKDIQLNQSSDKEAIAKRGCQTSYKKDNKFEHFSIQIISMGVPVKPAKLADVNKLVTKHFEEEWQEGEDLSFLETPLLSDISQAGVTQDTIDELGKDFCESRTPEEDIDLKI
ncbi:unnamed protein product [Psylliodes chrysocephalus]|uniref:Uncharacterized protein n=1 Tax=Psylliodes chrysocephalus TaxID=3402493 RepID=A0A9P0G3Z8_9CUCU|nr:unnamed protein product [Psylliodes chrysocephala]